MTVLPRLLDDVAADNEDGEAIPDAVQHERVEALSKGIPRLIALLPDILHRDRAVDSRHVAALEEMTKDLLKLEEMARPLLLVSISFPASSVDLTSFLVSNSTIDAWCTRWGYEHQPDKRTRVCSIPAKH